MMNKTRILLLAALTMVISVAAQGQETRKWTLKECIEYARDNNLSIQQQELNTEFQETEVERKKLERAPSLNGNAGYQMSFGRVPDETSYEFQNQTTRFSRFSLGTSMPLFQGFSLKNEIRQSEASWWASKNHLEAAKNDLALHITSLYLEVLFNRELVEVAREQHKVAEEQVENTRELVDAGRVAEGNLLEIKSQASREALNVTQKENNLSLALLSLAQALDLEDPSSFDVEVPEQEELQEQTMAPPPEVYETAVEIMPRIEAYELDLESERHALEAAKGQLYPSLTLDAGWNTNVSKSKSTPDFDFTERFRNNANEYVGVSLRIPIFNGLSARKNVKNQRLNIQNAQNELQQEKQDLRKDIQQAWADADAALKKYESAQTAVESYERSLSYTERKYAVGLVNPVDYSVARADYIKAQSDFLQAKYEYMLRTRILAFYMGEELALN
ncbi:MAG: TolC family protein [Marinilabiliaceae bacterium]